MAGSLDNALVVGGAGNLGRNIVRTLLERGARPTALGGLVVGRQCSECSECSQCT